MYTALCANNSTQMFLVSIYIGIVLMIVAVHVDLKMEPASPLKMKKEEGIL